MQVDGVIFDFDGVMADSLGGHIEAWKMACLQLFKKQLLPEDADKLIGHSTRTISKKLANDFGMPHLIEELKKVKLACLKDTYSFIKIFEGVEEVLEYLKSQEIPFGIASNAPADFIRAILKQASIKDPIIFGLGDTVRPKPAPDPFMACARAIRLKPPFHRVIVFEDSTHGIAAGVEAGMTVVGITTQNDSKTLKQAGAAHTYPSVLMAMQDGIFLP